GYLEVAVAKAERGGAGRPSKRYRATAGTMDLPLSVQKDDLLIRLLGRMLAVVPAEEAAGVAEEGGIEDGSMLARQMSPAEGHRSFRAALHAVADALTAHGFAAHAEARGGSLAIIAEHCPFGTMAVEHPVICAVDRGIVKGMLAGLYGDTVPATESSRPQGD